MDKVRKVGRWIAYIVESRLWRANGQAKQRMMVHRYFNCAFLSALHSRQGEPGSEDIPRWEHGCRWSFFLGSVVAGGADPCGDCLVASLFRHHFLICLYAMMHMIKEMCDYTVCHEYYDQHCCEEMVKQSWAVDWAKDMFARWDIQIDWWWIGTARLWDDFSSGIKWSYISAPQ